MKRTDDLTADFQAPKYSRNKDITMGENFLPHIQHKSTVKLMLVPTITSCTSALPQSKPWKPR